MSSAAPDDHQFPPAPPPARRPWSAFSEVGGDLRAAALVAGVLALTGVPVGLLWWALAPRADFRITAHGPTAIGNPSSELLAADDAVFALLLGGLGVLAALLAWALLRRRRGVGMVAALAVGTAAAAAVAWQLGQLLGPGPTKAELADVGGRVTTGLTLHSLPALAVGPFFALLVYVAAAVFTRRDDLGRTHLPPPPVAPAGPPPTWPALDPQPSGRPRP